MKKKILTLSIAAATTFSSLSFAAPTDLTHITDSTKDYKFSEFLGSSQKYNYVANNMSMYLIEAANGDLYRVNEVNAAMEAGAEDFADAIKNLSPVANSYEIVSVSAINKTTLQVVLTQEVDSIKQANFTIEGGNVTAASLGNDKKTVTLSVSDLAYDTEYTVVAKDIPVDGELNDFGSKVFKSVAVTDLWELQILTSEENLVADGADNLEVTFNLINKQTGQIDKDADNIVLDLNATYGRLASKRVTVQDGTATVLLTSEFSNTDISAKIDAQIIEASGDYKDLIGKVSQTLNIPFVTSTTENVQTLTLVSAEANQADRITLFFDKEATLKHFVKANTKGELLYDVAAAAPGAPGGSGALTSVTAKNIPKKTDPSRISHVFRVNTKTVEIAQGSNTNFKVKGFKPVAGNSKAMEVILDKNTALKDNAQVKVDVVAVNSLDKESISSSEFKVTDARKPEATSVNVEGLDTLKVKFSEAIADADFKINGRFVNPAHFSYEFGDFDPVTLVDNRDLATIELVKGTGGIGAGAGYDEDGILDSSPTNKTLSGYFSAGDHTLQISSTKDFAYATDSTNIGTTQNLGFKVTEDKAQPAAIVSVESPEQFRLKFDKSVSASESQVQTMITQASPTIKLQVKDINGTYVDASGLTAGKVDNTTDLLVTKISSTEFMIELTKDWTVIHDTTATNKNYYNYEYRLEIAKNAFTNVANGLKNDKMEINLNTPGSPLNSVDISSPVISNVVRVGETNNLEVAMNKPVKLVSGSPATIQDNAGFTIAQGQGPLAQTTVQFIGRDKDGKVVTINGNVGNYTAEDKGADSNFEISWNLVDASNNPIDTPQSIVDAGGSTEWTIVVRAISDDIGNTAASATFKMDIEKSAATNSPFFIDKYTAATNPTLDKVGKHRVEGKSAGQTNDTIEIVYSEGVQFSGLSDATNPANYTLNGETLPSGTNISIVDESTATHATAEGFEKVIITLPKGTLNSAIGESNLITVNKALISYDGSKIEGDTEVIVIMDEIDNLVMQQAAITAFESQLSAPQTVTLGGTPIAIVGPINTATDTVPVTIDPAATGTTIASVNGTGFLASLGITVDLSNPTITGINGSETDLGDLVGKTITVTAPITDTTTGVTFTKTYTIIFS